MSKLINLVKCWFFLLLTHREWCVESLRYSQAFERAMRDAQRKNDPVSMQKYMDEEAEFRKNHKLDWERNKKTIKQYYKALESDNG